MTASPSAEPFLSSLARIADFARNPFEIVPRPREEWQTGDYVVGEVVGAHGRRVELTSGRECEVLEGDTVLGALGERAATLEVVGSWRAVKDDLRLEMLTAAGLLGRATSISKLLPPLCDLTYSGHACRDGTPVRMADFVAPATKIPFDCPTILIVGTSMSAGKTTVGKIIVRQLRRAGLRVVACKLTGAGRYRDILAMGDAGASFVCDFVDVGMPSTLFPKVAYRRHLQHLLGLIAATRPDVVVAEAGASPLEPYNGDTLLDELGENVRGMVLCASDPYAVVGVMKGFARRPDLVAGLATSTSSGIALIDKLTGVQALNVLDRDAWPDLRRFLDGVLARS